MAGSQGGWEAGCLDGWVAGRLGGWAAGRLGGWETGGRLWELGRGVTEVSGQEPGEA